MEIMRSRISRVLALAVASPLSASLFAQDECASATSIALGANGPFTTVGSTVSAPAWSCGSVTGGDVWYMFTTPAGLAGVCTVDTEGSAGLSDTVLEVWDGCGGNLIDCDDDGGTGFLSTIAFVAAPGTTYYARVAGYGSAFGTHMINVAYVTPDDCASPIAIAEGVNGPFDTTGATTSAPPATCSTINSDIWFAYTASADGSLTAETGSAGAGSLTDTVMECWDLCGGSVLACDDDGGSGLYSLITLPVTNGTTYLFRAGAFGSGPTFGLFNLTLTLVPTAVNDECVTAFALGAGANGPYTNASTTVSTPNWPCSSVTGGDAWFTYTATACGDLVIDTVGSSLDTVLEVFDASAGCGSLVSLDCNDDTVGLTSEVTVNGAVTGQHFAIRVGGFSANFGVFTVNVTETPVPLANDDCAGALPIALGQNGPFSNSCATTSPEPWPCGLGGNDVWFTFQATCTAPHTIRTCGANYDTVLEVLDGTCGALISLACNDDSGNGPCATPVPNRQSSATVNLTNGVTYYVRVGGFAGARGTFPLEVVAGNGNGSIAVSTPSQCTVPGFDLAFTGTPAIGSSVAVTLNGTTGLPFVVMTLDVPTAVLAPTCPCMTFGGAGWSFGSAITLTVPCDTAYIGLPVEAQGVDILGAPAACNAFSIPTAFTDIYTITIQ